MKSRIIYIIVASLMTLSCSNFLEPKSKSEFVPKDANSLNELLLGDAYPRFDVGPMNTFLNLLDDDVACAPFQKTLVGQHYMAWWAAYTWQPDMYEHFKDDGENSTLYDIYKTFYSRILGANAVLDYIPDVNDDQKMKDRVIAQALALRGFYYFTLVNLFGNPYYYDKEALGVPLKLTSGMEENNLSRNKVSEVYDQILKDLLEAERLYRLQPREEQWRKDYKTSLPMVQLLLSRVYLYMEKWQEAVDYADKVIKDHGFYLLDLNEVATINPDSSRFYMNYHSYASPEVIWTYGNIQDVTHMVREYGAEDRCFFKASDELMNSYGESEGDLRESRYIVRESKLVIYNGKLVNIPQAFGKIAVGSEYQPSGSTNFARSFRLSEAYLNLSEAAAMLYKTKKDNNMLTHAQEALNSLRRYRFNSAKYKDENITEPDQLVAFVQQERRRELCFEDHRWFDLRRWGMKGFKHVWIQDAHLTTEEYMLKENDLGFTLPFPPEALNNNSLLKQNPLVPTPRVN